MSILPRHCQSGMKELSTVAAAARHRQKSIRTHAVLVLFSRFEFLLIKSLPAPGPRPSVSPAEAPGSISRSGSRSQGHPCHLYKWGRSSSPQAPAPGSISRPGSSSLLFFGISDSTLEFRTSSSGIKSPSHLPLLDSLSLSSPLSLSCSHLAFHSSPPISLPLPADLSPPPSPTA